MAILPIQDICRSISLLDRLLIFYRSFWRCLEVVSRLDLVDFVLPRGNLFVHSVSSDRLERDKVDGGTEKNACDQ